MAPGPDPDPLASSQTASLHQGGTLFQLLRFVHDATRALQHRPTQRGQFILLADAIHQRTAQLFLQHLDAAAECRLRDVQFLCCAAE